MGQESHEKIYMFKTFQNLSSKMKFQTLLQMHWFIGHFFPLDFFFNKRRIRSFIKLNWGALFC